MPFRPTTHALLLATSAALATAALTAPAHAIRPQAFTHDTESDFNTGTTDGVVVNSLGTISLGPQTTTLNGVPDGVTVIHDAERLPDGTTYLAAGPGGHVLRLTDDGIETVTAFADHEVFALDQLNGELLVAVSGSDSHLATLAGNEANRLADLPDGTRYVWDLAVNGLDVYAAAGTPGRVLHVNLAVAGRAAGVALLETTQPNVLAVAVDPDTGTVYAGTDEDGLVYRLQPADDDGAYDVFVAFDAAEPEVAALLLTDQGLYIGTADAQEATPGSSRDAQTEDTGSAVDPDDLPEDAAGPAQAEPTEPDPEPAADADASEPTNVEPTAPVAEVTAEDRDRLRAAIRERLLTARRTGELRPPGTEAAPAGAGNNNAGGTTAAPPMRAAAQEPQGGNAVYRLDAEGFVHEVFRESVMILRLLPDGDDLLIATGNEGQLYRVDPDTGTAAVETRIDAAQITAVTADNGTTILATANPAAAVRLTRDAAPRGTYTSVPLDASQIALFGTLSLAADLPEGASVLIETRSGNTADPNAVGWSAWSDAQTILSDGTPAVTPRSVPVTAPPARYFQYRLTLLGDADTGPTIEQVAASYVVPNQRPQVTSLTAAYPEPQDARPEGNDIPPAATAMNVQWEAADANQDRLTYRLQMQPAGTDRWVDIADDLTDTSYEWDTRRVPDGRYTLRLTARDTPDNPSDMALAAARTSAVVVVDNTPPAFANAAHDTAQGVTTITAQLTDAVAPITALAYAVDSADAFRALLPDDLIADSTREAVTVKLRGLAPGPHVVTLRAIDARGNAAFHNVLINID